MHWTTERTAPSSQQSKAWKRCWGGCEGGEVSGLSILYNLFKWGCGRGLASASKLQYSDALQRVWRGEKIERRSWSNEEFIPSSSVSRGWDTERVRHLSIWLRSTSSIRDALGELPANPTIKSLPEWLSFLLSSSLFPFSSRFPSCHPILRAVACVCMCVFMFSSLPLLLQSSNMHGRQVLQIGDRN